MKILTIDYLGKASGQGV